MIGVIERNFTRAVLKLYVAKGWDLNPENIEFAVSNFTGNMNMSDRYALEDFITNELKRRYLNE